MLRSLAIFFACTLGQAQNNDEIQLHAKVRAIVMLSKFSGRVIRLDVDPRFALTLRVESVTPSIDLFRDGDVVTFAIHSPAELFEETPKKGKTYDFVLSRTIENGKVWFCCLELSKYSLRIPR